MLSLKDLPLKEDKEPYGFGNIFRGSKSSYAIRHKNIHYCSCRTIEHAYYVRRELYRCGWDKSKLQEILDNYPIFYTDLLEFYRYISKYNKDSFLKWVVTIPRIKSDNGIIQHIRYSKVEDALFERDFLVKHDWDYELLVEQINDFENPYYDYQLPPYPERKIRNLRMNDGHVNELKCAIEMLNENPNVKQRAICEMLDISEMTLRNWFHEYNTDWNGFRKLVFEGKNPFEVLKFNRHIYTPDLSLNYNHFYHNKKSKKYPFVVHRNNTTYGAYPTKSLARKIVSELKKCDWDKSQLPNIQQKYGFVPPSQRVSNIYFNKGRYAVRKTINGKVFNYGTYRSYGLASVVRDLLYHNGWNKKLLDDVKVLASWVFYVKSTFEGNMFGGNGVGVV